MEPLFSAPSRHASMVPPPPICRRSTAGFPVILTPTCKTADYYVLETLKSTARENLAKRCLRRRRRASRSRRCAYSSKTSRDQSSSECADQSFFRDHRRRLDDYFAAAKNLLQMLEHPVLAYGDLHNRAKSLLVTAMGSLAVELCHLKIWKPDALASYLGCTPTSIWELARSSCRGGGGGSGSASSASWMSTSRSCSGGSSGPNGVSFDGYYMALSEERTVRSGQASSVTASHIDLKSVSILNKIADFMIGVGHEQMLRGAFDQHSEHLVRFVYLLIQYFC